MSVWIKGAFRSHILRGNSNFYNFPQSFYLSTFFAGFNVTDEYMKKSKSSKKHRKKHKKGKRGRHVSESSDDVQVAHKVDIVGEEMPEVQYLAHTYIQSVHSIAL